MAVAVVSESDIPVGPVRSFWCALRTLFELLAERKFPDCVPLTPADFVDRFCRWVPDPFCLDNVLVVRPRDQLRFVVKAPAGQPYDGKPVCVCFPEEAKLSIHTLGAVEKYMTDNDSNRAIVIGTDQPTPSAKQAMLSLLQRGASGRVIEFFRESQLAFNILRHELVPRHTPLTVEEEKAFEKRVWASKTMFRRLRRSDAVCQFLGLQRGTVVKVERAHEAGPGASHADYQVVE